MSDVMDPSVAEVAAWLRTQTWSDFAQSLADYFDRKGTLSEKQFASGRSMMAKCVARADRPKVAAVETAGIYQDPTSGTVFKVQESKMGRLYAKELDLSGPKGRFEYAAGAIRNIDPSWIMSKDDAAKFGHLHGVCCVCGAHLTDEKSIAAGIGPICATRF